METVFDLKMLTCAATWETIIHIYFTTAYTQIYNEKTYLLFIFQSSLKLYTIIIRLVQFIYKKYYLLWRSFIFEILLLQYFFLNKNVSKNCHLNKKTGKNNGIIILSQNKCVAFRQVIDLKAYIWITVLKILITLRVLKHDIIQFKNCIK